MVCLLPRRQGAVLSRARPTTLLGGEWGRGGEWRIPQAWGCAEPSLLRQVLDASSLLAPLPQMQAVTVSHVSWQLAASEGAGPPALRLSCTLHWSCLLPRARAFRVHCYLGTGRGSPSRGLPGPEKPTLLGLAFVNQYRIVDLAVAAAGPGQDGRVEFLVEPVTKEGFLVPQAEWGRAAMLYSTPQT